MGSGNNGIVENENIINTGEVNHNEVGIKKDIFLSFKQEPIDESDDQGGPAAKIQKIDTSHTGTLEETNIHKRKEGSGKGRSAVDYQNTIPTLELINDNRSDDHEAVF